ncbi:hypothetical protein IR010_11575 [Flavobacterium sp. MR2016-29]|uniref:hypothetical protein n=1 Tax=Flavobacterium sp. MR2016-29 TaxID=2783795 RepID=UPI00188BCD48|nr:hypothetical protein [Flavobacterium sp. MR2016-29]MBF4493183.1 hypothetical protein [Flavobacterium sp. MR2016-29]
MSYSKPKQPISGPSAIFTCVSFFFIFLIFKCSCSNTNENIIEINKLASPSNANSQTEIQYDQPVNSEVTTNEATVDDQFEVYNYIYSKGVVTKAETNLLFVNGKMDELQIISDMPDGQTVEISLINPVSLGIIKEMDSYIYTSTSDKNKEVNVFFHNGREMIGITQGNKSIIFMNTPDYK